MFNENEDRKLRKIYSEIINGFSIHKYDSIDIYIKHFSSLDNLEIDYLYTEFYDSAVKKGYPTKEERIKSLKDDGLLTDEKDHQIKHITASIESMMIAKRKAFLLREINAMNHEIKQMEEVLIKLITEKEEVIGATAEKYAKRQVDAFFISKSFYKDRALKTFLFTDKEFDEIEPSKLHSLYDIHYGISVELSEKTIKRVALKDFFLNVFSLAENIYQFFEKPIAQLTYQQIQLCAYGNFFKAILTNDPKPPTEILSDPERLEDWYYGRSNADEVLKKLNKNGEDGAMLVGLTNEDREFLGIENPGNIGGISMKERIKKAGGELSMQELMKIEGV